MSRMLAEKTISLQHCKNTVQYHGNNGKQQSAQRNSQVSCEGTAIDWLNSIGAVGLRT